MSLAKQFMIAADPENFSLTVGDKIYSLRYDFLAFRIYQKETGVDPFDPGFVINKNNLDVFLWAGLVALSPDLEIRDVQAWITPANASALLDYVGDAYFGNFPAADPGKAAADPPSA